MSLTDAEAKAIAAGIQAPTEHATDIVQAMVRQNPQRFYKKRSKMRERWVNFRMWISK